MMRVLFYILYYCFARHLPCSNRPYSFGSKRIRYWVCKHLFAECGKNVNIEHGADIGTGRHIRIGDNSGIGVDSAVRMAVIGKNVMMGPGVVFISQNHAFDKADKPLQEQGYIQYDPIEVGDNAWIGTRVIVLPGRRIGRCSIVGAGAVVTKDTPDYSIVCGNLAEVVRFRKHVSE